MQWAFQTLTPPLSTVPQQFEGEYPFSKDNNFDRYLPSTVNSASQLCYRKQKQLNNLCSVQIYILRMVLKNGRFTSPTTYYFNGHLKVPSLE